MIYLDTSVALAHLLAEDRFPPLTLWDKSLISSRILEYELWGRIHSRRLTKSHSEAVHALLERVALVELTPTVLARAIEPFPVPVRTLDALHLASIEWLRRQQQNPELATYDERLARAARALDIDLVSGPGW